MERKASNKAHLQKEVKFTSTSTDNHKTRPSMGLDTSATSNTPPSIERFSTLFAGYERAHGQHDLSGQADENGKIKGRAMTLTWGATTNEYRQHLEGTGRSLGLIPLLSDNTCSFGAIDVDIQGIPHLREPIEQLEKRVRELDLPLVVCRSKSGGAHLYLFASSPIPAKALQAKLTEFAALLGYGGCEVFPKQVMRVNEDDRGNWINLPYYGVFSKQNTSRYALRNGKSISDLIEFLNYCKAMRTSKEELEHVEIQRSKYFDDGPPCLQHLATFGLEPGSRNNGLLNIAIYYKKSAPADWEEKVAEFNVKQITPPLAQREVDQIRRNITRKDYFYTCKNPPLVSFCDKKTCAKRAFGIGGARTDETVLFPIDNLTKCISRESVRWYAEHRGMRMELTTQQLLSPVLLQQVFAEKYTCIVLTGKKAEWHAKLKDLMETCDVVQDPDDASEQGQFENMLDRFISYSPPARNRGELIKGNSLCEEGRVYFRSEDLFNYLTIHRFKFNPHQVWMWLKQIGATYHRMSVKGKDLRVWAIPEPQKFDNTPIKLPDDFGSVL